METTFTTQIDAPFMDYPIEAEITYKVISSQKDSRYGVRHGFEVEVTNTKYTSFGLEIHVEGKTWQRLEWICQERAEEHASEQGEAA